MMKTIFETWDLPQEWPQGKVFLNLRKPTPTDHPAADLWASQPPGEVWVCRHVHAGGGRSQVYHRPDVHDHYVECWVKFNRYSEGLETRTRCRFRFVRNTTRRCSVRWAHRVDGRQPCCSRTGATSWSKPFLPVRVVIDIYLSRVSLHWW